jgi:Flp pilus assembly protein TadB
MLQRVAGKRRGERGRVALSILDGHPRQRRLVGLALTAVAIEIGLLVVAWFGPAFRVLLRPVYVLVATIFVWMIWRSARRRSETDRRHADRRQGSS